jgi:hypothetical protein
MAKSEPASERDLKAALQRAQDLGRGGDTLLVHVGPREIAVLKAMGGAGTINPKTGLREFLMMGGTGGPTGGTKSDSREGQERTTGGTKGSELPKPAAAAKTQAAPAAKAGDYSDVQLQDVDAPKTVPEEEEDSASPTRPRLPDKPTRRNTLDMLRALS